ALRNVETVAQEVDEKSALGMVRSQEKLRVLDEAIGVKLPRGVTRFVSELLPLGPLMDVAFSAGVIFFLIEALSKGIEKIIEWAQSAEKISEAWAKVDEVQRKTLDNLENDVIRSQIKLDELSGKTLEALRLKLQLIDNLSLDKLAGELDKIALEADKAFQAM